MALDDSDKYSLGFLGASVAVAFGLLWLGHSRSLAESSGPKTPPGARTLKIRKPVLDSEGQKTGEYTETTVYIMPGEKMTEAELRKLQQDLKLPETGILDTPTAEKLGELYSTYEITSGPLQGKEGRTASLYDVLFKIRRSESYKGTYGGETYRGLAPRTAPRTGAARKIKVEEAYLPPSRPSPRAMSGIPRESQTEGVPGEGRWVPLVAGEGAPTMFREEKVMQDIRNAYRLATAGSLRERAPGKGDVLTAAQRAKRKRETVVGSWEGLSRKEREAYMKAGLFDKSGNLTPRGQQIAEEDLHVHPFYSVFPEKRQAAAMEIQKAAGLPATGVLPMGLLSDNEETLKSLGEEGQILREKAMRWLQAWKEEEIAREKAALQELEQEQAATRELGSRMTPFPEFGSRPGEVYAEVPSCPICNTPGKLLRMMAPGSDDPLGDHIKKAHPGVK